MSRYDQYHAAHSAAQRQIAKRNSAVTGVEIFKIGRHKPMFGEALNFLDSDLQQIAASYDAKRHPAPIVIGHPKTDAPAYGWVTGLRVESDKLVADFGDIEPEFSELVKAKRYRKISASFWIPSAPNNPTPGHYSLKHVGFLGAAAPAVPGLKDAAFNSDETGTVEFGDDDIADLPVEHLRMMARHHHEITLDKLVGEGKLLPSHKIQMLDFVSALDDGTSVSFSDGCTQGKADWLLRYLKSQPPMVSFGELDVETNALSNPHQRFDLPHGYVVDPERQALADAAQVMAQEEGISFSEAARRLGA
ncbi:hypothetical protein [Aliiroseovarius marinus]|uniref:hypothetical protein n=1 Tax=Aliiroseovarius marinus TaxID=2500159 RepID=UPI003D7D2B56